MVIKKEICNSWTFSLNCSLCGHLVGLGIHSWNKVWTVKDNVQFEYEVRSLNIDFKSWDVFISFILRSSSIHYDLDEMYCISFAFKMVSCNCECCPAVTPSQTTVGKPVFPDTLWLQCPPHTYFFLFKQWGGNLNYRTIPLWTFGPCSILLKQLQSCNLMVTLIRHRNRSLAITMWLIILVLHIKKNKLDNYTSGTEIWLSLMW